MVYSVWEISNSLLFSSFSSSSNLITLLNSIGVGSPLKSSLLLKSSSNYKLIVAFPGDVIWMFFEGFKVYILNTNLFFWKFWIFIFSDFFINFVQSSSISSILVNSVFLRGFGRVAEYFNLFFSFLIKFEISFFTFF